MKVQRIYTMTILPTIIMTVLIIWQLISFNNYSDQMVGINQLLLLIITFLMTLLALFFRYSENKTARYFESLIDPIRPQLIGLSCFLIGGIHFLSVLGQEPVYMQLIFVLLIIAYFETSLISIKFVNHFSNGMTEVTSGTIQRLLANLAGKLGMVLVLSVTMIYLSLLVIVGFTGPFSVAFLAAIMILAIAFMTLVRRL